MKRKILVVDDDLPILDVIKTVLEDGGYEVILAEDEEKLKAAIHKELPDLILLDIWLSGNDGQSIAKELRQNVRTRKIPIIMISAHNAGERIARDSGVAAFLAKPFDIDTLLTLVASLVEAPTRR